MKRNFFNLIDRKKMVFSLIMGLIIAWMIRNPFTQFLMGGKGFAGRNIIYKFLILGFLIVSLSILIYLLLVFIVFLLSKIPKIEKLSSCFDRYGMPIIAIFVAFFSIYYAVRYSGQPLLEAHGFRQTQTALASYWMIKDGWKLAYETPVIGYPWSVPFEFPLYQSLVALIAWAGKFTLDPVGRLVSFAFLLACAWPAFKIVKRLELPAKTAWLFIALLWSSPLYLFWGRAFMIETAALFFTFAAVPYLFDLFSDNPGWKNVILFSLWGTLGALQKSTTALPALFVMAVLVLIDHLMKHKLKMPSFKKITCVLVAFLVPVLIGLLWTHYTDVIKSFNLIGSDLTSQSVTGWMPGTLQQRFDPKVLKTILWDRIFIPNGSGLFGITLLVAAYVWGEKRIRKIITICLILMVFPLALLTNVHYIHDYYQTSSTLFLIGGLAISIVAITEKTTRKTILLIGMTILFITSNLVSFSKNYEKVMTRVINPSTQPLLILTDLVERYTPKDSAIAIFGKDWSGEIGYYSERKSLTVPDEFFEKIWPHPSNFLGDIELGAMINCLNEPHPPSLDDFLQRPEIQAHPFVYQIGKCYLWMPDVEGDIITINDEILAPMPF